MDNLNLISTNLNYNINNNINNNIQDDSNIKRVQQNLILMGFDLTMVNKVILYFKIRTENEALEYLIKSDDGMWNHPFIPKEIINENNRILEQPKLMMNSVISHISNTVNIIPQNELGHNESKIDYKIENDICEICGELKEFHKIKDYNMNNNNNNNNIFINQNNNNNNNNDFDLPKLNLLIDEDENEKVPKDNYKNHILVDDEEDEKDEEIINPNICPICMDQFENPVELEKCKHKFCFECFNSYLVNLINQNNIDKIPCPENKCSNKEIPEEFFSNYLSEQEYFKYRQFKSKNEIARDEKKFFCPHCDSYAQIEGNIENYDSNNPNYKKSVLKCKNGHEFCSCGRPLHENDCYHDENEFKELIVNEKIKKCPKCGFLIKKNEGCNHMTCGNPICKYEFCWLCMNEAVPGHYEYGPCAGKQFFDPDSFSYWLEQNYPFLGFLYIVLYLICSFIFFVTCFIAIPGIGLFFIFYGIIYETNEIPNEIPNKCSKFLWFLSCICIGFCCESIIYIFWGIFFSVIAIIFSSIIISISLTICSNILKCLFFPYIDNNEALIEDNENNEIEMANAINVDNNNNNNNNEGNNNINE